MSDTSVSVPPGEIPTPTLSTLSCPLFRRSQLGTVVAHLDWLWHGYVARGQVTLLTGQWKVGKTTLLAALLGRMGVGGVLAGRAVRPGRVVVLSEEGAAIWLRRCDKFDIGDHVAFAFRPFRHKPVRRHWDYLLRDLGDLCRAGAQDLLVFDPLASLLPGRDENGAATMLEVLLPLRQLTEKGVAVLMLHHPRKHGAAGGQAARGSGALAAFTDIVLEMHWYDRATTDRRRVLRGWSRHDDTPRTQVLELSDDGSDYHALGDIEEEAFRASWRLVEALLRASGELTAEEMRQRWVEGAARPTPSTLWGWLTRALAGGLLVRCGAGRKGEPYRYRLPDAGSAGEGGDLRYYPSR
jgi:hypothetical protein